MASFHSRKLFLETSPSSPAISTPNPTQPTTTTTDANANVIMILSVLLCAVLCGLGLHSILRCAFRCSSRTVSTPPPPKQTGLRRKAVRGLPVVIFSDDVNLPGGVSECAICLSDFMSGERLRVLPKCKHGFHVKCIDRWLMASSSCPTCRQCLFPSPLKLAGCAAAQPPAPALAIDVLPLEPAEGGGRIKMHDCDVESNH
ncbi:hypothetical protein J5N97_012031 [Dioscorea zingiberensis]|uniref:RING-type domain-containing protein n=1 Tax=Dioscorea zingiberensis TaxID=325984 RepID=A0A9D5CQB7_9LILI|nr:hypothetical protein J5N97_012031 [Dioscorea zingiberensis]